MDYRELTSKIVDLVDDVTLNARHRELATVTHFVDHGEPEEALDLLVAILVRDNLPITPGQRERLRELMRHFEFDPDIEVPYPYLNDQEMLDRMTVVDEFPS